MKFPIQAIYGWYRNALRHPKYRWWIVCGSLLYLLSPIDISPDVFPVVGEIDDIALVAILAAEVSQIAVETLKQRRMGASTTTSKDQVAQKTVEVDAVSVKE
ncbi:MAG TPA: YkvA family protein [Stenomitos sp.]